MLSSLEYLEVTYMDALLFIVILISIVILEH